MKRPISSASSLDTPSARRGFTLVEVLVATALSLMLMGAVVAMFARVTTSVTESRAILESADRLRLAAARLQQDLGGATADLSKTWHRPEDNEGYFEYVEGPVTQANASTVAVNTDNGNVGDTTVGDWDDILMLTTRSAGRPFVGKLGGSGTVESDVAEVAWFLRGRTLYRRVLLVAPSTPNISNSVSTTNFYANYDLSVRANTSNTVVLNSLGDLTKRENRFAHDTAAFPFDIGGWYWTSSMGSMLTLPTLRECSSANWVVGRTPATTGSIATLDLWSNNPNHRVADAALYTNGTRIADDVILTNVIGFDVKAWDPTYVDTTTNITGAYVDLGNGAASGQFATATRPVGRDTSNAVLNLVRVYDTWPTSYEQTGAAGLGGTPGNAVNGFDDDSNNVVDDSTEFLTSPPYPFPLRGIQVKIRIFEPDSRQVREVTVVQDFLRQ